MGVRSSDVYLCARSRLRVSGRNRRRSIVRDYGLVCQTDHRTTARRKFGKERQRAEMITHVTGGKALPRELADQIVDRTDGVPLFIEELTKTVLESGILTETGDRYTVAGPVAPLAIPTTLHGSLLARLDRQASIREVAQIGAALGRSFSHELISAVV